MYFAIFTDKVWSYLLWPPVIVDDSFPSWEGGARQSTNLLARMRYTRCTASIVAPVPTNSIETPPPHTPTYTRRKGIRLAKSFHVLDGNNLLSAQRLEVSLLGVETVLRLERDAWSMVK